MKETPILFSGRLVRAIREGRKTQTRRVITPQPAHVQRHEHNGEVLYDAEHRMWWWKRHSFENLIDFDDGRRELAKLSPYGQSGDRLWVRETWYCDDYTAPSFEKARKGYVGTPPSDVQIIKRWRDSMYYRADAVRTGTVCELIPECMCDGESPWKPSIHMPRWASRTELDVKGARVERLQDISEEDAKAEGVYFDGTWWQGAQHEIKETAKVFNTAKTAFESLWDSIKREARIRLGRKSVGVGR